MNSPSLISKTMSSLEIAELTGKEHSKVTADIKRILSEVEIDTAEFRVIYKDSMNRSRTIYNLPRRECDLVVSGYVPKYRLAIIDRWQELETSTPKLSRMDLIQLAMDAEKEAQTLAHQVEEMKPSVIALDRIASTEGSMTISIAAKNLQMPRNDLFSWLSKKNWIFKRKGSRGWEAYSDKLKSAYLEHKVKTYIDSLGVEQTATQARVTPKGLAKLSKLLV